MYCTYFLLCLLHALLVACGAYRMYFVCFYRTDSIVAEARTRRPPRPVAYYTVSPTALLLLHHSYSIIQALHCIAIAGIGPAPKCSGASGDLKVQVLKYYSDTSRFDVLLLLYLYNTTLHNRKPRRGFKSVSGEWLFCDAIYHNIGNLMDKMYHKQDAEPLFI